MTKGDICVIADSSWAGDIVKESHGLRVQITHMGQELCWITVMEGPWTGRMVPCLVSRLEVVNEC
jgi:hypothetical protein